LQTIGKGTLGVDRKRRRKEKIKDQTDSGYWESSVWIRDSVKKKRRRKMKERRREVEIGEQEETAC
jgi:hypothetical protein